MGRPKLNIDPEMVRQLAMIQCTYDEMAAVLRCHRETIMNRFSTIVKMGWEEGKSSLKRAQYKAAMNGNPAMLIWLGKQHLGQCDEHLLMGPGKDGEFKLTIEIADENKTPLATGDRISQYIEI